MPVHRRTQLADGRSKFGTGLERMRDRGVVDHATVDEQAPVPVDGRQDSRDGSAGQHGIDQRAVREPYFRAGEDVARDDVERNGELLQTVAVGVPADQPPQRTVGDQVLARAEEAEEAGHWLEREHLAAPDAEPQLSELVNALRGEVAPCEERAVDGADRGADQQVRANAFVDERSEHADLNRAQAGAARKHEGDAHDRSWVSVKFVMSRLRWATPNPYVDRR